jgi:hypothetical protein
MKCSKLGAEGAIQVREVGKVTLHETTFWRDKWKRNGDKLVTLEAKHREGTKMTMRASPFSLRSPFDDYDVVIWQI